MKYLIAATVMATATTAAADYRPNNYAYEATMQSFGAGQNILAHELANCPVRHGSNAELYSIVNSTGQAREDAMNVVFDDNPAAVVCILEVLVRYDLVTIEELSR